MNKHGFTVIRPYSIMDMNVVIFDDGTKATYHVYDTRAGYLFSGFSQVPEEEVRLVYCIKYAKARGRKYVAKHIAEKTPLLAVGG